MVPYESTPAPLNPSKTQHAVWRHPHPITSHPNRLVQAPTAVDWRSQSRASSWILVGLNMNVVAINHGLEGGDVWESEVGGCGSGRVPEAIAVFEETMAADS